MSEIEGQNEFRIDAKKERKGSPPAATCKHNQTLTPSPHKHHLKEERQQSNIKYIELTTL